MSDAKNALIEQLKAAIAPELDKALAQYVEQLDKVFKAASSAEIGRCIDIVEKCRRDRDLAREYVSGWNAGLDAAAQLLREWRAASAEEGRP